MDQIDKGVDVFINEENLKPDDEIKSKIDLSETGSMITNQTILKNFFEDLQDDGIETEEESEEKSIGLNPVDESDDEADSSVDLLGDIDQIEENSEEDISISIEVPPTSKKQQSSISKNHGAILLNIHDIETGSKELGIKQISYNKKRVRTDINYAIEINQLMQQEYDQNTLAFNMREFILFVVKFIPMIFNGERKVFKFTLPDLKGYDKEVNLRISELRRDSVTIAKKFNGVISKDLSSIYNFIKVLGFPLITTFMKNNCIDDEGSLSYEDHDIMEEDIYDESSSE